MPRPLLCGLAFAAGLGLLAPATAQPQPAKDGDKPAAKAPDGPSDDPTKKFPPFDTVVKGAKLHEGLLNLHQKDDHVYAELQPQHLDKPFLLPISIVRGAGMGGDTLNFGEEWVVLFHRVGDNIYVVRRNTRFKAAPGSAEAKGVETAYSDSVVQSLPIKTLNPAKGSVVIDLNGLFFGDFGQIGLGSPDPSRTHWGKIKTFKKNVELQVNATYSFGRFGGYYSLYGFDEVIDPRGVGLVIQYGLCELPDDGYKPRYADTRVGHFLSAVKDFSATKENLDTSYVRMVNRWRLERADGQPYKEGMRLAPPKKRIVFWIEDSVPDEYRTAVREGILEWNKAFEKVGFKDAIEVRQQDGQEFDPEDITYATFRWTTRDGGGAIGPSRANPLTGEILDADILFDGGFIRSYSQEHRVFRDDAGRPVEPASMMEAARRGWEVPVHPLAFRNNPFGWNDKAKPGEPPVSAEALAWHRRHAGAAGYCQCASHKRAELALAGLAAAALAPDGGGARPTDELLQQAVKEITMHEVGHTLGLRHNFKASTMLPNDKLHDTSITRKKGLVGSVMDYSPANIAPKGVKQGDYFTTTIGPYDYWAIEYAYRPIAGGPDGEKAELAKIASKVATPDLVYGTDEDLYGSPDPYIGLWDLGSDPMQFSKDRVALTQVLMAKLADKVVEKGEPYARLRLAFQTLLYQYGDAAYNASAYVGGVVVNRDHKGDPNGRDPLIPVAGDKQREALRFLQATVLTDKPFTFPPELLRKLAVEKWYHWGSRSGLFGGGEVDFPVNERVLSIQQVALRNLFDAGTLTRLQNTARTAAKGDKPLAVAEVFRAVSDSVFADLPGPDGNKEPAARSSVVMRNLQRAYLDTLAKMVLGPKAPSYYDGYYISFGYGGPVPADAKSLARMHLKETNERVKLALKAEKDDTVKAHLEELQERIAKVLDAKLTANEP